MNRAFTLVEVLVAAAILVLMMVSLTSLEQGIFSQNSFLQNKLLVDQGARSAERQFVSELRAAAPSDTGAYAIAAAASTSITFYSDVDGDGLHDRIRYFVAGNILKRGILKPTGSPLIYVDQNETVAPLVYNLATSSPTIFSYYDENYAGTSTPLNFPVDVSQIRLIKLTLALAPNSNPSSTPAIYQSEVVVRSLKDNL